MSIEIVIIGAGLGGLASAILLSASGVKVRVLERLPVVGGRTSGFEARGYRFDLGPTFFLYPRILDEVFRVAGTSLEREEEMIRLDPQYRILFGAGGKLYCSANIGRMEAEIAQLSLAQTLRQMLHLRPNNRFEDFESVYLVGGGTYPGSGLPVIFESAKITSRLLLEDLRFGPPCQPWEFRSMGRSADDWSRVFEHQLESTQDALAQEAIRRDPQLFETQLRGGAGQGGVYDFWRGMKARLRGETFSREHRQ